MVLRTFVSVFPHLSVWQPALGDLILVGSREPIHSDLASMERRFAEQPIQADLARVRLLSFPVILAREIIPQENGFFTVPSETPIHSDYVPQLEYVAQKGFFLNRVAEAWRQYREDFSPRAGTLLGAYLRHQPLTEADFNAFVADYQEHRLPEPIIFRSLLQHRQDSSKAPGFSPDLWTAASEHMSVAELRALRLAPLGSSFMDEAATNAYPLRVYCADLMESYRAQRSVFYLPPTVLLEQTLQRLLETDPARRRIYRLNLAELAWDRGDDARCLELGKAAFDSDLANGGPVDFSPDVTAPLVVLYRMAESLLRRGQVREAWTVVEGARAGGYMNNAESLFPLLGMEYRKIEAAVGNVQPALAPPRR